MLELARSEPGIAVLPDQLDRDPWLVNCVNGTLDLRDGKLRGHRREDYLTKLCPTPFDPEAACPAWERFLLAIFRQDGELIRFVQRLLGRALSGDVSEQILPIFWGGGANGKSTLVNAIMRVMGPDYAMKASPDLLMSRRGERHPTELADLFGMRLVVASETHQGRRLDEALIKDMTSGERIRARRMREDFWEFDPTHKIILLTNHKPAVTGTDTGIWRRLRLVPFEETFWDPEDPNNHGKDLPEALRQDKTLPERLQTEARGILAWLVRGCSNWLDDGLTLPDKVRVATADYRVAEDRLQHFLGECCLVGPNYRCRAATLYARYRKWCEDGGEESPKQRVFGEAMTERGFGRTTSNGTWYLGVTVRQEVPDMPD
jgi:putative DNA primase/helicase